MDGKEYSGDPSYPKDTNHTVMVQPRGLRWEGFGVGGRGGTSEVPLYITKEVCLSVPLDHPSLPPLLRFAMGYSCLIALNPPSAPPFDKLTICSRPGNAQFKGTAPPEAELIL